MGATRIAGLGIADVVVRFGRSLIAHGIANQATTVMIRARAAITMIAHSVTQIANGTRFRCMFGQIKRGEVFHTIQKTSRAMRRVGLPVRSPRDVVPTNAIVQWVAQCTGPWLSR